MRRFLQWSHTFYSELVGDGSRLRITVPLHTFTPGDRVKLESCVWNEEFHEFVIKATFEECLAKPTITNGNIYEEAIENVPSITGLLGGREIRK